MNRFVRGLLLTLVIIEFVISIGFGGMTVTTGGLYFHTIICAICVFILMITLSSWIITRYTTPIITIIIATGLLTYITLPVNNKYLVGFFYTNDHEVVKPKEGIVLNPFKHYKAKEVKAIPPVFIDDSYYHVKTNSYYIIDFEMTWILEVENDDHIDAVRNGKPSKSNLVKNRIIHEYEAGVIKPELIAEKVIDYINTKEKVPHWKLVGLNLTFTHKE